MPIFCLFLSQRAGKSWQGDSRLKIHNKGSVSKEHPVTAWASGVLPEERNSIHFLYLALSWPWEATHHSFMVNKCHEWGQTAALVIDVGILWEEHSMISLSLPYRKKNIQTKSRFLVVILHDHRDTNIGKETDLLPKLGKHKTAVFPILIVIYWWQGKC